MSVGARGKNYTCPDCRQKLTLVREVRASWYEGHCPIHGWVRPWELRPRTIEGILAEADLRAEKIKQEVFGSHPEFSGSEPTMREFPDNPGRRYILTFRKDGRVLEAAFDRDWNMVETVKS